MDYCDLLKMQGRKGTAGHPGSGKPLTAAEQILPIWPFIGLCPAKGPAQEYERPLDRHTCRLRRSHRASLALMLLCVLIMFLLCILMVLAALAMAAFAS